MKNMMDLSLTKKNGFNMRNIGWDFDKLPDELTIKNEEYEGI